MFANDALPGSVPYSSWTLAGSLAMSVLVFWFLASWQWRYALLAALLAALALTQILAHGMTSPLREMTKAARAMSNGDYSIRVRATSRDEIGELARAFNKMSADLDAAEQNRRELIANVSHELRTPISALRAVLENIVDGVAPADPAAMRTALEPYVKAARRTSAGRRGGRSSSSTGGTTPKEIRAWAAENGIDVPARGRIPAGVHEQFLSAKR